MKIFQQRKLFIAGLLMAMALPVFAVTSDDAGRAVNDTVITTKIKASLVTEPVTHAININVETHDGKVTLSGTAQSETEAAKAVEIAESTHGVRKVDADHLRVEGSNQPLTDAYITAKVKGAFIKNNLTPGEENVPVADVKVETQKGVVYLSGTVENTGQGDKLVRIAKSVDGVSDVKSTLTIE